MSDLTEFLLAEIAEDEAVARATDPVPQLWSFTGEHWWLDDINHAVVRHTSGTMVTAYTFDEDAPHIARWNPSRVLAELEAKRRIVEMHRAVESDVLDGPECGGCSFHEKYEGFNDVTEPWPCATLRLLALPYADHPDYREEWRP